VPDLASIDSKLLWPNFGGAWPTTGPYIDSPFSPMGAWGIPAINTALLLSSGVTLTIAHHAMLAGQRSKLIVWLAATIILGCVFLGLQAYEYIHAYSDLNLKLTSGIFGSTFYMLTGFHGFHVTVGAIMLFVVLIRCMRGHFDDKHHFAFEAAAWYWHFVDVVWLGLFVIVYML
jgi:cytochrome c oxidase subunit III